MARNTNTTTRSVAGIYVATDSFACEIAGERYNVQKGERVREGHPLIVKQAAYFEPLEDGRVHYEYNGGVEDASASPGSQRNR